MHEKGLSLAQKAKEMDIDTLEGLKRCQLFAGLTDEEIISLAHQVRYRVLRYRKGELFTLAGAVCQHAAIILSGEMAAKLVAPTGRIIQMSLHHSGNPERLPGVSSAPRRHGGAAGSRCPCEHEFCANLVEHHFLSHEEGECDVDECA